MSRKGVNSDEAKGIIDNYVYALAEAGTAYTAEELITLDIQSEKSTFIEEGPVSKVLKEGRQRLELFRQSS